MKDYVAVAGQLGVTHILGISQTNKNIVLKIAKTPDGPTTHFRITNYSLAYQVKAIQKRPYDSTVAFTTAPLVVLNNFGQSEANHIKLMKATFQHMFPSINVKTVHLTECRRVVLFHYKKDDDTVEMRHYAIRAKPTGISRTVKRVIEAKVPLIGNLRDVAEYIENDLGAASDSEAEDEAAKVILPERFVGKGNGKSQQSALKLSEIGPRITFTLFKVERGLNEGDILYHKDQIKTEEEATEIKRKAESSKMLKMQRKAEQDANVKRKRLELEEMKALRKDKKLRRGPHSGHGGNSNEDEDAEDADDDDINDNEEYDEEMEECDGDDGDD